MTCQMTQACCRCNRRGCCKGCVCKKRGTFCTSCLPSRLGSCDNCGSTTPSSHGPLSPLVGLDTSSLNSVHQEMLAPSPKSSRDPEVSPVAASCRGSRFTCATYDKELATKDIRKHMQEHAFGKRDGQVPLSWLSDNNFYVCSRCNNIVSISRTSSHSKKCAPSPHSSPPIVEATGSASFLPSLEEACLVVVRH